MIAIRSYLRRICTDSRGATAIEYGLIAALIVMAMMVSLGSLGGGVAGKWLDLSNTVGNAM
ncbi:pilus assembly protein Flp/PilA [Sphingomonas sp. F9_3S_D5_B_2]